VSVQITLNDTYQREFSIKIPFGLRAGEDWGLLEVEQSNGTKFDLGDHLGSAMRVLLLELGLLEEGDLDEGLRLYRMLRKPKPWRPKGSDCSWDEPRLRRRCRRR
jgi:hypothetical protein